MKRASWLSLVVGLSAVAVAISATAAGGATTATRVDVNVKHARDVVQKGTLPVETRSSARPSSASRQAGAAVLAADPPIGTVRLMPVLDDTSGQYRIRQFTLRALGEHIEVWVQSQPLDAQGVAGINFPVGDCRNDGVRNVLTDAQIAAMVAEFDNEHLPEGVGCVQRAPDPGRHERRGAAAAPRAASRLLRRRRRQDRDARLQRPRRQLLRHEQREPTHVHRRLLLVADQRLLRSQRDDDRRVRLAASNGGEPARQPVARMHAPPHPHAPVSTRVSSRTSTSTCSRATRIRTRSTGSTRASPTGRRPSPGTSIRRCRSRTRASTATSSASSAGSPWRRP